LLDDRLTIACGAGALRLLTVQRPGKAPLGAAEFLRGFKLIPGTVLP
jgi:methionyl-tRNA formyltransferase